MRIVVHGQQAFGNSVLEKLLERGEDVVGVFFASMCGFIVGLAVGGAGTVVGGGVGCVHVASGGVATALKAALEGHNYVPLPRTRVWGTRGVRP